jgi:putative membrane protein
MNTKTIYLTLLVATALFACSQPHNTTSNSGPDKQSLSTPATATNAMNTSAASPMNTAGPVQSFLAEAAAGGMAEVELGKLAQTKAQNADVKQFGEMMVNDHGRANEELKSLAARKNIPLPTAVEGKHKETMNKLQGLSGAEFDRAYVDDMLEDHEADVQKFESEASNNPDSDVKAFAEKTLPTLRRHLERIQSIKKNMK